MKIYEVVQKISIDPLYLEPATPLGRFCPKVNSLVTIAMVHKQSKPTWLPWYINNLNTLLSKAYLTTLNLNNFKMIEAMGLNIIASRSP
jgi:hypothetical protein